MIALMLPSFWGIVATDSASNCAGSMNKNCRDGSSSNNHASTGNQNMNTKHQCNNSTRTCTHTTAAATNTTTTTTTWMRSFAVRTANRV